MSNRTMDSKELLLNFAIIALIEALKAAPGIIEEIRNSTLENKDQLINDIKVAQSSWPEWV